MTAELDQLSDAACVAVGAGDWERARRAFESLVERDPTAEALFGLGDVLWWQGETTASIRCLERAYAAFQHRGDPVRSAMTATGLYLAYRASLGSGVVARGWLARAAHVVEDGGSSSAAGWVALMRGHDSDDPIAAERWATEARRAAAEFADPDLELCALSQLGVALVAQGRGAEGTAYLDEAMAAALAGEAERPHTVVFTSCNLVGACAQTADLERALQWIRAADGFQRRYGNPHLYTTCRTHLGAILFASGDWVGAERELRAALDLGATAEPDLVAEAAARLAELRLAQGRLAEAERLLEGFEEHPTSAAVRAALAAARGDGDAACRIARRRVGSFDSGYRPGISGFLEQAAAWEVLAAVDVGPSGEQAVRALEGFAATTGCAQLEARALYAAGLVRRDVRCLERALSHFARLRLPLHAARARLALAQLLDGDDAIVEARAALAEFETLGAARDADMTAALLRQLGVTASRGGPAGVGQLTRRELEVLDLLGEGLANREIADRLFLSRKTVERHVRNVLFKLGLRNRTEAAAFLLRHRREIRSTD